MLKSSVKNYGLLTAAILVFAISSFVGCSSKNVASDVSSSAGLSVTVNPSTVATGETSVVEATISDNGTAVPNQEVTFSVVPSTAGFFSPSTDTTDASGIAATVFTATTSGSATITVSVNGASLSQNIGIVITDVAQSGSGNVNISLTPSLLLANGQDTSRINVIVRDGAGFLAPESTLVKFAAGEKFDDIDGNGSFTFGVDTVIYDANNNGTWDAIGFIPSTAYTNANGLASVDFVSGYDATTVYIVATVDDGGITGFGETTLQLLPNATVNSIYMSSDSLSLSVKGVGGIESSTLRAVALDVNGNPVPEGITVQFIITDGPGLDEHLGSGAKGDPFFATTNSQGMAVAPIHSGTVSGTIRIRASVDTVLSNATQVLVAAGPPAYIEIGAEFCNIDYWDDLGHEVIISALIVDVYQNGVSDSTVVYFTADEGSMKAYETRTTDHEGRVSTKWFSGHLNPAADGRVVIIAETSGGTVADTGLFYSSHLVATLTATGYSTSLRADGEAKTSVRLQGWDLNGNPVVTTAIEAVPTYLTAEGGSLENGCPSSVDYVTVTSTTLKRDYSLTGGNDDGIGAVGIVIYRSDGGASTTININLTTGIAYGSNSSIDMEGTIDQGLSLAVKAEIFDVDGNPLGDHTLVMTASAGTITPGTGTQDTGENGEAIGFIWTSPGVAGDVIITITDTDPRGGVILTKKVTVN